MHSSASIRSWLKSETVCEMMVMRMNEDDAGWWMRGERGKRMTIRRRKLK